jgi:hypothetical protein
VILLFLGVAVAPSINSSVVKTSKDNDLIEVTSQAYGTKGFGNTTVKLTKQQYQNLEQYLVDFRARLNQTTTREEAVPIFKDAVVELNKYGLLPKGMSVEQAQKLVTSQYQAKHADDFLAKVAHNPLLRLENDSNFLCLIAGNTDNSLVVGGLTWTLFSTALFSILAYNYFTLDSEWFPGCFLLGGFFWVLAWITGILGFCSLALLFFPVKALGWVLIGDYFNGGFDSAHGWVVTFGLNGVKFFNNEMYGQYPFFISNFLRGALGFTGISLDLPISNPKSNFFLGGALAVKIGPNPPPS